jgi:hypothetical protein
VTGGISGIASAAAAATAQLTPPTPDLRRGQTAAREFEAQLIGSVLASFEKTFACLPGQDAIAGEDNYDYIGVQAFATALADGGGFGIAKMIASHLPERK